MMITTSVWGDGFADDCWAAVTRVGSLDDCCDDELIRFFPLCRSSARGVIERLRTMVSARVRARPIASLACPARPQWFEDLLPPRLLPIVTAKREAAFCEARALTVLSDMIARFEAGGLAFDERTATSFAFHAGLHPAYLWPEALVSHERETAAGWLGHVARGRPALLPLDIADYLDDVLQGGRGEGARMSDPVLSPLLFEARLDLDRLSVQVGRRLRGGVPVVRRGAVSPPQPTPPGASFPAEARWAERARP